MGEKKRQRGFLCLKSHRINKFELFSDNRFCRTNLNTIAAIRADFGIDHINLIAFTDRLNGAFGCAGAAANAFVGNSMSHFNLLKLK